MDEGDGPRGKEDIMTKFTEAIQAQATGQLPVPDGAQLACRSHIDGRNATVTVWPDRVEWARTGLLGTSRSSQVILRSAITGVSTSRSGFSYTNVLVQAGHSTVTMRVRKAEADSLRSLLMS